MRGRLRRDRRCPVSTKTPDANLPPDMLMMLGRMDGKLDSLLTQTASNTAELKDLNGRVASLEADRKETGVLRDQFRKVVDDVEVLKTAKSEATGSFRGAAWIANGIKIALGACAALGLQAAFVPKKEPVANVQSTIHVPVAPTR